MSERNLLLGIKHKIQRKKSSQNALNSETVQLQTYIFQISWIYVINLPVNVTHYNETTQNVLICLRFQKRQCCHSPSIYK